MPNLTSFIKPTNNKKGEKNQHGKNQVQHQHQQQQQQSGSRFLRVDGHHDARSSRDKSPTNGGNSRLSPRLGFFWRSRHHGKSGGNNSNLHKSGSQSRIVSASSTSLASSGEVAGSKEEKIGRLNLAGHIPKCNTVANFQQVSTTHNGQSGSSPVKCNSVASFGPLRRGGNSLAASLASLGLSRAASVISGSFTRCSSHVSFVRSATQGNSFGNLSSPDDGSTAGSLELCRLCLCDMPTSQMVELRKCGCKFCHYCLQQYIMFQVFDGNVKLTCPDAHCEKEGVLLQEEIETLADPLLFERYQRYQLNYEVDIDPVRAWCPRAGCETICSLPVAEAASSVQCPTCDFTFCSKCKLKWHSNQSCEAYAKKRMKTASVEEGLILNDEENASIKRCPLCRVPIERDEGCAQMMCKRCKHVFCWYCLTSLDDDFLLRHYDKGPCKNKLGHTRASVFWHRTQVVGIFAGFGLLLLVASPFLLLVAPCIVYSGCKSGCKPSDRDDEGVAMTSSI